MPITLSSFGGTPFPLDVQARIINLLVDSAPFSNSLTRQPTTRKSVAWPVASPSGWAWLAELGVFPEIGVGDDAVIAVLAKCGGVLKIGNESISDSSLDLTALLTVMLRDSLSRDLDLGVLTGGGPPEPDGVLPAAPSVTGADLLSAVSAAIGGVADSGGVPDTLAISGTQLAAENAKLSTAGGLAYPNGFGAAVGLRPVVTPGLSVPLVYASASCYLVINGADSQVDASPHAYFNQDAYGLRVKARVAAGIPAPLRAIRKLLIGTGAQAYSVSPRTGPAAGGTAVTVKGTAFTGATAVQFGGVAGTAFAVTNDTTIAVTTPAGTAGSTVTVTVKHANGDSNVLGGYVYAPAAAVTAVRAEDEAPARSRKG
jgi:hypothetical protein